MGKCKHQWKKKKAKKEDKQCGYDEVWECQKCGFFHLMLSDLRKFFKEGKR